MRQLEICSSSRICCPPLPMMSPISLSSTTMRLCTISSLSRAAFAASLVSAYTDTSPSGRISTRVTPGIDCTFLMFAPLKPTVMPICCASILNCSQTPELMVACTPCILPCSACACLATLAICGTLCMCMSMRAPAISRAPTAPMATRLRPSDEMLSAIRLASLATFGSESSVALRSAAREGGMGKLRLLNWIGCCPYAGRRRSFSTTSLVWPVSPWSGKRTK
mmetsp:Transcript_30211/g.59026  ORF Transcript_30211/g.59026 Transcript_30211/m.59026 type:complete len:223 (-) Transcript_30211:399-1067(-)